MLTPLTDGDPRFIGPYRVTNRIGAGGMGAVYLGFDDDERAAAVKVPFVDRADDPQFRSRFGREVESVSRVRGRCVAQLLAADPDAEQPWMAAEYVEGASLGDAVKARGPVEPRILNGLAVGLADALVSIHAAGVVHRDLKPSNILLAWDGPKVIDFGIAKAEDSVDYTRTGMLVGTLVWMSPEQLRGSRAAPAADVFAWGACLAYAATGRPPFQAEGMHAVALQILNAEPDVDGVPDHLLPHVLATLAKDPNDRPTANQLLTALVGRRVDNVADADSVASTALGSWVASPPTAAETAAFGRTTRQGDRDRDRTGLAAVGVPLGYGGSGQGGSGQGGSGYSGSGQGGPGPGGTRPGSTTQPGRPGGLTPTTAAVIVVVLLLVAGGIALALALSSSGDGDQNPGPGVTSTSTVGPSQTPDQASPSQQTSGAATPPPGNGSTRNPTPGTSPSGSPSATPSAPTSPTAASPTPTPTPTQPPATQNPTTPAPTTTGAAASPTVPAVKTGPA